jgi:hypothetical protein
VFLEIHHWNNHAGPHADVPDEHERLVRGVEGLGNANPLVLVPVGQHDLVVEGHPVSRHDRPKDVGIGDGR